MRRMLSGPRTLVGLLSLHAACLSAQDLGRGSYVVTLGRDTLAVEHYEQRGSTITGQLVLRTPATAVLGYELTMNAQRQVTRAVVRTLQPSGEPVQPRRTWDIAFGADSIIATRTVGDSTATTRAASGGGAMPLLHPSQHPLGFVLAIQNAMRLRPDSNAVRTFSPGSRGVFNTFVKRVGRDHALFGYIQGARLHVYLAADGTVDSIDHHETTMKVMTRRARPLDALALARDFAARDAGADRIGALSPRDSLRARVGRADITIRYGRPAARGRRVFGELVPWGEVWRAGADAATSLELGADIEVGGVRLPAGHYTLFLRPGPDGATLMVNGQTGQWGTAYDPARDVRHFAMRRVALPAPVERVTFSVAQEAGHGVMRVDWDSTRYQLDFTVLP